MFFSLREVSSLNSRQSGLIEEKMLTCFTCPVIITSETPSRLKMSISFPSCPMLIQWKEVRQLREFRRGFVLDGNNDHLVTFPASRLERQGREAAVTRRSSRIVEVLDYGKLDLT